MRVTDPDTALGRIKQRKHLRETNQRVKVDGTSSADVELISATSNRNMGGQQQQQPGFKLGAGTVQQHDIPFIHRCDLSEEAIRQLFVEMDEDGNGMVTREEVLRCTKHTRYAALVKKHLDSPDFRDRPELNYSEFARFIAEKGSFGSMYKHHIQVAIVVAYFAIGALAFIYGDSKPVDCDDTPDFVWTDETNYPGYSFYPEPNTPCTEPWTFIDSLYFGAVTVTTVGYGDFGPSTDGMKVFTIFFIAVGLSVVGSIIAGAASEFLEAQQAALLEKMDDDPTDDESPHLAKVVMSIGAIFAVVFIGALFFGLNEDWSFLDAFYWSFVTTTTVGYGDLSLTKESSRLFSFFYIITSTMVVAAMLGNLASISMEIKMEKKQRELMARKLDMSMIAEMDRDGDGVDAGEFLAAMLCWLGKVNEKDTDPILAKFAELDEDGSGKLDKEDLEKLAAAAAKEAEEKAAAGHH